MKIIDPAAYCREQAEIFRDVFVGASRAYEDAAEVIERWIVTGEVPEPRLSSGERRWFAPYDPARQEPWEFEKDARNHGAYFKVADWAGAARIISTLSGLSVGAVEELIIARGFSLTDPLNPDPTEPVGG